MKEPKINKKEEVKNKKNKETRKEVKKERVNIFKKITGYFKGVGKEVKRIKWTGLKELGKYSLASIFFVAFFALYFYIIDVVVVLIRSLR